MQEDQDISLCRTSKVATGEPLTQQVEAAVTPSTHGELAALAMLNDMTVAEVVRAFIILEVRGAVSLMGSMQDGFSLFRGMAPRERSSANFLTEKASATVKTAIDETLFTELSALATIRGMSYGPYIGQILEKSVHGSVAVLRRSQRAVGI